MMKCRFINKSHGSECGPGRVGPSSFTLRISPSAWAESDRLASELCGEDEEEDAVEAKLEFMLVGEQGACAPRGEDEERVEHHEQVDHQLHNHRILVSRLHGEVSFRIIHSSARIGPVSASDSRVRACVSPGF